MMARTHYGRVAEVVIGAAVLGIVAFALASIWVEANGNLAASIDLGGRWGKGTLGSAVAGLGSIVAVVASVEVFMVWSLIRKWPRSSRNGKT